MDLTHRVLFILEGVNLPGSEAETSEQTNLAFLYSYNFLINLFSKQSNDGKRQWKTNLLKMDSTFAELGKAQPSLFFEYFTRKKQFIKICPLTNID